MSRCCHGPGGTATRVTNDPRIRLPGVKTYKGAIYDALVEMIAELGLPPGTRLVEADLVSRFNVSKTPIREAFLQLEGNGLIELEPYVGARVSWLSVDDSGDSSSSSTRWSSRLSRSSPSGSPLLRSAWSDA